MRVIVHSDDDRVLTVVGDATPEQALEGHGYDPNAADYSVDDPDADLQEAIQNASNLQELKDALTDSDHPAKSRGRGR